MVSAAGQLHPLADASVGVGWSPASTAESANTTVRSRPMRATSTATGRPPDDDRCSATRAAGLDRLRPAVPRHGLPRHRGDSNQGGGSGGGGWAVRERRSAVIRLLALRPFSRCGAALPSRGGVALGGRNEDGARAGRALVGGGCSAGGGGRLPGVRCGRLVVPERRSGPGKRRVRLFVTRLPSRVQPVGEPVVVLQGGPGDTPDLASFVDHRLRDGHEVIILDQRGTGRSVPSLACPEVSDESIAQLGKDPRAKASRDALVNAARACRKRLVKAKVDLGAYNTRENAADVADLRRALHIAEWDLVGNSYGSRLALTVLRDHPQGVRAVAGSGVYPPNENSFTDIATATADAFDVLFAAHPGLRATFVALVRRLEREPVRATAATATGQRVPVLFDGDNLVIMVRAALYQTSLIPAPARAHRTTRRRPRVRCGRATRRRRGSCDNRSGELLLRRLLFDRMSGSHPRRRSSGLAHGEPKVPVARRGHAARAAVRRDLQGLGGEGSAGRHARAGPQRGPGADVHGRARSHHTAVLARPRDPHVVARLRVRAPRLRTRHDHPTLYRATSATSSSPTPTAGPTTPACNSRPADQERPHA